jgi:hypothetical protein
MNPVMTPSLQHLLSFQDEKSIRSAHRHLLAYALRKFPHDANHGRVHFALNYCSDMVVLLALN